MMIEQEPQQAFAWWLVYLIVYIVTIAATILLTPKPEVENAKRPGLGDFDFPTATEGRALPVVWGTCRIAGPNVVWYGDLHTKKMTDTIDGGWFHGDSEVITGYVYYVALDFGICFGPIDSLIEIEITGGQRQSSSFTTVSVGADTADIIAHGYSRGSGPHRLTTTGTLPSPLTINTDYYLRDITADTIAFYLTRKEAKNNGTKVNLTTAGSGTHTLRDYRSVAFSGAAGGSLDPDGELITIDKPMLFGGREKGGGLVGQLRLYDGVSNQNKNAYLVSVLGQDVPAYVDLCHAVWERGFDSLGKLLGEVGEATTIKPWSFTVQRFPNNLALTGDGHIINEGDANPAEVLYEVFTNNVWGLGRPASTINFTSFQTCGNTLFTEGNGFSTVLDTETRAEDFVAEVLKQIDASLYIDLNGEWTLKLARADYTIGSAPLFDETNIISVDNFTRGSWDSTINDVSVEYLDRTDDFKDTFAMGQDIANYNLQGGVKSRSSVKAQGVKHPATAAMLANREIRALSFPHARVTLTVDRTGSTLNPSDVLRFSWPPLSIVQMPLRVIKVGRGELLDGKVTLECIQDVFGVGATIYSQPPPSGWTRPPTDNPVAFSSTTQHAFDSPYWFMLTDQTLQGSAGERVFGLGQRPNGAHAQFRMFVDAVQVGISRSDGFTPSGLLNAAYSESTSDIDASSTLVVKTPVDFGSMVAATAAQIEALGANLIKIDDEILGFESITYNSGPNTYTLNNVHRGLLDTLPAAHALDARVWVLTQGIAVSNVPYAATASLSVKLLPETPSALLPIENATAIALVMSNRATRPLPAGAVTFNSARYPGIQPVADVIVNWFFRHRDDPKILDQNDGNSTLGRDSKYGGTGVRYYVDTYELDTATPGALIQSTAAFTAVQTHTITSGVIGSAQAIRVIVRAVDDDTTLATRGDVSRDIQIFNVGVNSIDLNGTDEALRSTAAVIGVANTWSIAFWVKRSDADTNLRVLAAIGDPAGANSINFIRPAGVSSDLLVEVRDSGSTLFKARTAAGVLTASAWVHVCATFDGGAGGDPLVVYVNGVSQSLTGTDTTGTMTDTARRICVGSDSALANFATGRFFDLAIISGAVLSGAEVTAIYNAGNGSDFNLNWNHNGYTSRADLEQWFRLGHDSSPDADIGKQYSLVPTGAHNLMDGSQNITTAGDVVVDAP